MVFFGSSFFVVANLQYLFIYLFNMGMRVNLNKLYFSSSHFSSQPSKRVFHPSIFLPSTKHHKTKTNISSIHLCFEGIRRFQINLQGLYVQSGARPIESSQLTSSHAWIQEKTNPIKFKSNWSKESKEICTKSKSNSD